MAFTLKPVVLKNAFSAAEIQKMMRADLKSNAGKTGVKFVAAKNVVIGGKTMSLFIVTDNPVALLTVIKEKHPKAVNAQGLCDVSKDKDKTKVIVKSATGGLSHAIISTIIKPALGNDPSVEGTTPEREKATRDQEESEKAKRPKPDALTMAKASHLEAGDLDWKPDQAALKALAEASRQMPEFAKFKGNFDAFMSQYGLSNNGKLPTDIWNKMFQSLLKSEYKYSNKDIEKAGDGRFKLLVDGPGSLKIREKTLVNAMAGLKPFVDHAAQYLDKIVAKGSSGATWAFWSGTGAEDAAKASGGVSLEGTVGSFFGKYQNEWIDWGKLLGPDTATIPLWTSLSEMYAVKGAEYIAKYKFIGFVGPGATNDNNVFNSIEQPAFLEVFATKKTATPNITWQVVDCDFVKSSSGRDTFKGEKGTWTPTGKATKKFDNRVAALGEITSRYEK
jgi:hypothetical protein